MRNLMRADKSGDALNGGPAENFDSISFKLFQNQKNKENLFDDLKSQINERFDNHCDAYVLDK